MDRTTLTEKIIRTEIEYPGEYATRLDTEFGVLFYNLGKKALHLANHAVIYPDKITDFKTVLVQVRDFYLEKGIQPRIYQHYPDGYLMANSTELRTTGFDIQTFGQTGFMLLSAPNIIPREIRLEIRELKEWDQRLALDIMIPNNNPHTLYQVKINCTNPKFRVFAGYLSDRAVSVASVYYSQHGVVKLNSLETAEEIRGRGFARELISEVVEIHKAESDLPLYVWPLNVTAEKICSDAGFRTLFKAEMASAVYAVKD